MASKLGRKEMPGGYGPDDFKYMGRPAKDQGDFGSDVGIADCACVNQFGEANNSKYYHGGVVQSGDGKWWVYLEWGRINASGKSWNGSFRGQDFMFVACNGEDDARAFFDKQMNSKNTKRLIKQKIAGVEVWTGKPGKDGYIVQSLATRERGLPDAYGIKDDSGVSAPKKAAPKKTAAKPSLSRQYHPAEIALATSLLGGTQDYTRALSRASGVVPTMDAILKVRDDLIPAALERCQKVGDDVTKQVRDAKLQAISKMVFAMVPRHIPRTGLSEEEAVLNASTVLGLQQDLDAFEASLRNEDWSVEESSGNTLDPDVALKAVLRWIDPKSEIGAFVANTFQAMTRDRHGYIRGKLAIKNIFSIERSSQDTRFLNAVRDLAAKRAKGTLGDVPAGLQPKRRPDISDIGDHARQANVFVGIHGTRAVNVAPIIQSHLRLPKSLSGVHITGAAFGHGIYFATDWKKSYGYTGHGNAYYGGGGNIKGRGFFMFLADVAGGKFYYPKSAWGINTDKCPNGCDSVYAHPSRISSLQNDEHVIFNPDHCRLHYLIEGDVR
jgi:hypothetical protein